MDFSPSVSYTEEETDSWTVGVNVLNNQDIGDIGISGAYEWSSATTISTGGSVTVHIDQGFEAEGHGYYEMAYVYDEIAFRSESDGPPEGPAGDSAVDSRKLQTRGNEYDVLREVFPRLWEDDMRRLRSIRAKDQATFEAWLRRFAGNATINWAGLEMNRWRKHWMSLRQTTDVSENRGPTMKQVEALIEEIAKLVQLDVKQVRIFVGFDSADGIPNRTLRHRKQTAIRRWPR